MYEKSLNLLGLPLLSWVPLLPLIGAAINLSVGRKLDRKTVHGIACGSVLLSCAVVVKAILGHLYPLWHAAHEANATVIPRLVNTLWDWIPAGALDIEMGLWFDPLTAVMTFTITFVGFLIHVYSTGYMSHERDYARFFGYLNLFTGAMLLLVLGDNLVVLFVGWEGVGVCSYLLIGFWYDKNGTESAGDANATAGKKAFLVNRIGDFAFILGMFVLFFYTGTLNIHEMSQRTAELITTWDAFGLGSATVAGTAALLLLIGATGKSAQVPLYVWLPDAMAGPTPVSALIHAATMVTAGIYMVTRLNFVYLLSPTVMGVVALVGGFTALFAATIGFAQNDIKKVLAYSTVSQLGYMFLAVGVGAYSAGVFHLFTHAFFKACLFLCAGSVIHAMSGRQDVREMGGLRKVMPHTHWTFLVSTLAITGIPLFSGFFSKDEVLWKAISQVNPAWPEWLPVVLWSLGMLGAVCTAFYMFRLYYLTFSGHCRADDKVQHHLHESPPTMTVPLMVLGTGAALLGFLGLPGVIAHGEWNAIHHWLQPVVAQGQRAAIQVGMPTVREGAMSHNAAVEWGLMAVSVVIAVGVWLGVARRHYRGSVSPAVAQFVQHNPRLHRTVKNKYYVDEVYQAVFITPLKWLSRALSDVVDKFFIDFLIVNGSAKVVDIFGLMLRGLQNGNVQRYAVGLVVGVAAIVFMYGSRTVEIQITAGQQSVTTAAIGQQLTFTARVLGATPNSHEYRWSFGADADAGAWQSSPSAAHTFTAAENHEVKLTVRNKQTQRETTSSTRLRVRADSASTAEDKAEVR